MTRYRFQAATRAGEILQDELEADSEAAVVEAVHARGQIPIRITPARALLPFRLAHGLRLAAPPSAGKVALFARHLAMLLDAGMPLDRALELILAGMPRGSWHRSVESVLGRVRGGTGLADSLAAQNGAFPRFLIGLVRAGESAGNLGEILLRAADHLQSAEELREKIRSALIYPMIVLLMTVASVAILLLYVLPQFRPLFEGAGERLPAAAGMVLAASDLLQNYWAVPLLAAALLFGGMLLAWRHARSRRLLDGWVLRLPVLGNLAAQIAVADLARTIGALLANGVVLFSALEIARESAGNARIGEALDEAREGLRAGKGFAEPLRRTGVFPALAIQLIQIGEEAGRLDEVLLKLAAIFDRESQRRIANLLAILVPAVTILMGGIVALVVGSVISAVLSTYQLAM